MSGAPSASRVVLNVLSNWGGQAAALLLSFLATPFVVRTLGDSAYGIWVLMAAVAGYLSLLDVGVRGAVTRYVAKLAASRDDAAASRTFTAAVQLLTGAGLLAVLASLGLASVAVPRMDIPVEYLAPARIVLLLAGLNVAVSLASGAFAGVVAARHRFDLLNAVDVVSAVVRTSGFIAALVLEQGLVAMAAIQLLTAVARGLWLVGASRRLYPELGISFSRIDRATLGTILSFSVYSFVIQIGSQVIYYTDTLVIAAFLPVSVVTSFAIAGSLVEYARALTRSVSFTTAPMASALDGAGDHTRVSELLLTSGKSSMLILLPMAVTFLARGESFIGLWMGPSYARVPGEVLFVLALPLIVHAGTRGMGGIMLAIGRHRGLVPAVLIEAAVNVALSVALVRTMGIVGVAWGTAVPAIASSVLFWPWYIQRAVGLSPRRFVEVIWLRPWLAVVPFTVASVAFERWWPAQSLWAFFLQVGASLLLTLAAAWRICLSGQEQRAVAALVREWRSRLRLDRASA